jgi:multicomponent Na+:H+ antiporter subunit E
MFALRFCLLFVTWCAFSGHFDFYHLFLGALASAWVSAVSSHIALSQPNNHRPVSRMELFVGLMGYIVWLMVQVLKANVQVLKLSFAGSVKEQLTPCVVEFRTLLPDDFSRFALAQSITLTPGTVTIRVDGDRFIVHALTEAMSEGVPGEMEERLLKLFGAETVIEQPPTATNVEGESSLDDESKKEIDVEDSADDA